MYVFYFFAAVLIWLSVLSLRGGFRYLAFVKNELNKPKADFAPFASIIAPCRGLDAGLKENLAALFRQDYPDYEIVFVVDGKDDKAVFVIEQLRLEFPQIQSKLVVAGKASESAQKVHNLRFAVGEVNVASKVFAFVDSDARPNPCWLRSLVAPLADEKIGAATGYRWFLSEKHHFSSELCSVWNASIASALGGEPNKNFCWGGSTAISRQTFEKINMRERWRGTLSDDFAVTRAMKENNLGIYFVPACLTAAIEDFGFDKMIEFTTRQMKITRVYAPHFWKASLAGGIIFSLTFWTGVFLTIYLALSGAAFALPLILILVIFALGAGKAYLRLEAVKLALPQYKKELARSFFSQTILWCLTPPIYLYNGLAAAFSRKIVWRGIVYEMKSPNETVILSKPEFEFKEIEATR